jgi:hypothetical protein
MKQIRLARTVFAALMAAALVGLPTRPMLCDMATHDMAAAADGHHHEGPLDAGVANSAGCAECDDMTGCCLAPAGALYAATPDIPITPEHAQDAVLTREHRASNVLSPLTPPPQA